MWQNTEVHNIWLRNAIPHAEQQRAAAGALLHTDGTEDPRAELGQAHAGFATAEERLQAAKRHANAIALVHRLFEAQQQEMAEHFSRPLAEKIATYLQPVFGPRAQAVARFDGNDFTGVELARQDMPGALSFDLGARHGLQIIVLTCHRAFYTALGAGQVFPDPPRTGISSTADSSSASISRLQG